MDDANILPNDLGECQRLLLAAFKEAVQLERRAADAQQRASDAERKVKATERRAVAAEQRVVTTGQQVSELNRVLDATATSFEELQQEHAATLEELAWYKRWVHGRKR